MTFGRNIQEQKERRAAERAANLRALATVPANRLHTGTYEGTTAAAAPKTAPLRNPALLRLARGMPCLLLVPGCCNHRVDTTVACHSNLSVHGKAGARKADDCWSCWGCSACHSWLDQGPAPLTHKTAVFMSGMARQVEFWRQIAVDTARPEADRNAATWALFHLGVA